MSVSGTRVARRVQAGVAVGVCVREAEACNGSWLVGRRTMAPRRTTTGAIATAVQEVKWRIGGGVSERRRWRWR